MTSGRAIVALCTANLAWLAIGGAVACGPSPASAPPPTPIASSVDSARDLPTAPRPADQDAQRPRYDLGADERRGGHTLERHVGRTDEQLRERLRREPDISAASTYTDRQTAERVVAEALHATAAKVDQWRARVGRRPNLVVERDDAGPVGRFPRTC